VFSIGDQVVYPKHGAGVIKAIEEREILGDKRKYYIMQLPVGDMKAMVPLDNAEELGLRPVISEDEAEQVMEILAGDKSKMSRNWNRRFRANKEKIKTGDIYEVAEVVRNLAIRDQEKGLSTKERRMLDNAKQILISELVLVWEKSKDELEMELEAILTRDVDED